MWLVPNNDPVVKDIELMLEDPSGDVREAVRIFIDRKVGPLEFQMDEFDNDLGKINVLISAIINDLNRNIPKIESSQAGIKWLNNSVEPYQLLSKLLSVDGLDNGIRDLITNIQEFYHVSSIVSLTAEQLKALAISDQGKQLKRAMLNTLYPLKTPKNQKVFHIHNAVIGNVKYKNDVRLWGIKRAGESKNRDFIKPLILLLKDKDKDIRTAAENALARLEPNSAERNGLIEKQRKEDEENSITDRQIKEAKDKETVRLKSLNDFQILDLPEDVSKEEARKKLKKLSIKYHYDTNHGRPGVTKLQEALNEEMMFRLNDIRERLDKEQELRKTLEAEGGISVDEFLKHWEMALDATFSLGTAHYSDVQKRILKDGMRILMDDFSNRKSLNKIEKRVLLDILIDLKFRQIILMKCNNASDMVDFVRGVIRTNDKAMTVEQVNKYGGITLNAKMLDLQIKRDGNGVPLPLSQQPLDQMNIQGFVPQIISIQLVDLPDLLGINFDKQKVLVKV